MKKTIAILFLTGVVLYGALNPQHAIANDNSIVGSWIVHILPNPPGPPGPIRNLATFTKDGGTINSDPSFGGGHGVWEMVGSRTFAVKFLTLVPPGFDPPFPPESTITVTADALILDREGDELTGPFLVVITHPLTGQQLFSYDGTVILTRITLGKR